MGQFLSVVRSVRVEVKKGFEKKKKKKIMIIIMMTRRPFSLFVPPI
jgi:hypothetical protein